ncbi:TonB-dependent receptor [Rheinheimera pacifica]|uniref:TonB-dependent receptor n=1 Tax=Rheinheimera pacifica TaxID=173990 RepID=UPI002857D972|nr:TonB-dependent receptor [Rheinheimera pacifica]MDR6984330.1 TonB-dependent receptor [Rheinheimera pacifica]
MKTNLCKSHLALAVLAAIPALCSNPLQAQSVAAEPVAAETEVIEVKGFRSAIIKAKDLKREAMIAQDSIVAEDIADFPDLNLADSLQRVPGVTITREGGEGRQISLRGLGPDFTRVQVNGMEALGTSSSPMDARGGVTRSRAFDFNIFASELFNQIDVKKSYSADQEEGGIAGTVNLRTAKPFDYDGAQAAVSAQLGTNSNTDSTDPRIAALLSNTWSDFGALVSVAYSDRDTMEYGSNTTRWRREGGKKAADASNTALQAELDSGELWFPRGHRYSVWENEQSRLGVTAALQYKPSQDFSLVLDLMHGKLENKLSEHHHAVKDNSVVNELVWRDNNGDKEVIYADYKNATWRNENRQDYNESVFNQISLTADWTLSDTLKMRAMLGHSSSDYEQPRVNKLNIEASKKVNIITDFSQDAFYGHSYSPDFDVTTLEGYTVKDLYFQSNFIYSDFDNARLDFDYYLTDSSSLKFGANYKKFSNTGFERVAQNFPTNPATPLNQGVLTLTADQVQVFHHPDTSWLQGDMAALQAFYGLTDFALTEAHTVESSAYDLTEETRAAYLVYDKEYDVAGAPLRLNVGVRYFNTEITSAGLSKGVPTQMVRDYSDYLPSLNIAYEFTEDVIWRTGISKNMTRPSLGAMAFSANVSQTSLGENDIGQISVGNPNLQPFESDNFDTALEWYFEDVGLASIALFYKDIDNFIVTETQQIVYRELGLPAALLPVGKTVDDIFNVSSPQNSDSSSIKGFELALQRDLDFLPAPFNNLGVIANYTWADGKTLYRNVENSGEDQVKAFPGLSKQSYNLTLYYETEQWGARVAAAYRSKYITGVESGSIDDDERGYHATTNVDFSAFYRLTDNVKLNLEAINLTNVRDELYSDSSNRAYNTTYSGRTYMAGVTVQF